MISFRLVQNGPPVNQCHHRVDHRRGRDPRIVAGHDHGLAAPFQLGGDGQELRDPFAIEVRGRLVGDDDLRVVDQRPGNGDALHLAARQMFDGEQGAILQAERIQQLIAPALQSAVRNAGRIGRQHHVLEGGEAADQIESLKDETEQATPRLGQEALR